MSPVSCDCVWVVFRRPHSCIHSVVIVGPWAVDSLLPFTIPLYFYDASGDLGCDTPVELVQHRWHDDSPQPINTMHHGPRFCWPGHL